MKRHRPKKPTAIVRTPSRGDSVLARRPDLAQAVRDYVDAAEAANTRRARRADWRVFESWCGEHGTVPLPASPETVAAFLADQSRGTRQRARKAVATVTRYARSVQAVHQLAGYTSPTEHEAVKRVLRGVRRERGTRQEQKEAFTAERLGRGLPPAASDRGQDVRDRALLLLGLTTAMRRSEICSLDVSDLQSAEGGLVATLRRSKTDQEGEGRQVAIPRLDDALMFCPVRALARWSAVSGVVKGPLLRGLRRNGRPRDGRMSDKTVCDAVKRAAERAGFDVSDFGAHSLRAGYVTTARQQGVDWGSIMEQTGHKRLETVKLYSRHAPEVHAATRVADVFEAAFASDIRKR